MATFTERLAYLITGSSREAVRAFKDVKDSAKSDLGDAEKRIDKFNSTAKGIGAGAKGFVGGIFGGAAVSGFASFAAAADKAARQVEVWRVKVNTVFEDSAQDIRDWANQNNESFGLSDDQLAGLASSFGDLIKPMGFTANEAAKMSQEVVGLSAALSAWSGGQRDTAEVADILAKAMLGEREALKGLGISISEADVQAVIARKGQTELTGAVRDQAEALATQELLFSKSTDAQKAWASGALDAVKAQNELQAEIAEAQEQFGKEVAPVKKRGLEIGTSLLRLVNVARKVGNAGSNLGGVINRALGRESEEAAPKVEALGDKTERTGRQTQEAAEDITDAVDALTAYKNAIDDTLGATLDTRGAARDLAEAEDAVAEALGRGGDRAEEASRKTRTYEDALEDVFGDALDVGDAHDSAADAVERLAEALGQGSENAAEFRERLSRGDQTVEGYAQAVKRAARDAVRAARAEVDAMAESGEIADTAGARNGALADRLIDLRNRFPQVAGEIDGYLNKLRQVPNLSTEAQTAEGKAATSKKDLAEATDDLIEKARDEADQQDTVIGKYTRLLELLEGLKTKYPEVAGAIQQAITDTNAAIAGFWTDPNNNSWGAAMTRQSADRLRQMQYERPGLLSPAASAAVGAGFREAQAITNNINVSLDLKDLKDPNAIADITARKIAFAIGRR